MNLAVYSLVVMVALIKFALHAVGKLLGKSTLNLAFTEGAGDLGALATVIGIGWTDSEILGFGASGFAPALLVLPAIQ